MSDLQTKLTKRLEESVQTRNAQQAEIKQLQAELQKLLHKIPRRPRESIPQLDQQIRDLEHKRTITSVSLAEERQILKQIHGIQKAKKQVEEYQIMDRQVQDVKVKLDELKTGQKTQRDSIQEIEAGLSKVKLANQLGCATQELVTVTMECPKDKLGTIIGKQGSRMQQLMDTHRVTMDVDKQTCMATLTGGADAVEAAKAEIASIARSVEVEVILPAEVATYLAGSHVDAMAILKGKFEDIFVDVIRGSNNKAAIRGDPERVEEAKKELLAMEITSETRTLVGREFNYLLGQKGLTIDRLVKTHSVVIEVNKNKADDTATATVTGPPEQVAATMEDIQELMDSNREVVETIPVDAVVKQILLAEAGVQIKALQSKVNEQLKAEDETASCYLGFPKERHDLPELLIKAKQSIVESATSITESALKELQDLVVTFTVDAYIVPRIIGKGGETIKKLTHGKPLFLEVDRSTGKVVVGATTAEGRDALLAEVQQIVGDNSVLRIPGDPELMKAQYRELGRSKTKALLQELVWLDIDELENFFILRGKKEDLDKAQSILEEYLASNSLDEIKVIDEDFDVLLSGGKGSKLVKMSQEIGVNMSADRSRGIITLRGPPEKVATAKSTLAIFLNGGDGQSVAKVSASDQVVGTIIGKGGQTRKDLESKYAVSIHISKAYRVSIRGPEDKVQQCRLEILKMISAARVTQVVAISADQQAKLDKNDILKRITQETNSQLSIADDKVTVRGVFHDVMDAISLLNEKLTGEYKSSVELGPSQFSRVSATCRDPSHIQRIETASESKVELMETSGEIQLSGKRSSVRKGKDQVYEFLGFVCPGEFERLKITKPLYKTVGQPTSLAEVAAAVGGSTIYLDRDTSSIIIRDSDVAKVEAAVNMVAQKIKDAERLAYVVEIAPDEAFLVSYIIGKNGGRIKSLEKGTGCHVDISKETRTITLSGDSEEEVTHVREKLDALVAKARRENVLVQIPDKAIPAFVGHGGKKIKDFSKEHDVELQRVRKSSQFKIEGEEDKVVIAKKWIDEWIEKWQESNSSLDTSVEKQFISAILGEKGSTAQAIEKEFGCKIDVDRQALRVTIRGGDKEKRQNALTKINEIVSKEASVKAERAAAKKKESETKVAPHPAGSGQSDPSEVSTAKGDDFSKVAALASTEKASKKKEEVPNKQKGAPPNPFPSKPVGVQSASQRTTSKAPSSKTDHSTVQGGTEQGRNLFNLLLDG